MKPSDLLPDSGEKRQFRKRVADPQPHEPVKGPGLSTLRDPRFLFFCGGKYQPWHIALLDFSIFG